MVDFPPCDDTCGALEEHVRRFFAGQPVAAFTWETEPIRLANPHFRVLRVEPVTEAGLWQYISVGGWATTEADRGGLEFILSTATATSRAVELLAMSVYYHRGGSLGLGHTVPIGEPWLPGSACDHLLISLPYPFGPGLQTCHVGDRHVDFLWLLPVTAAERDFKAANGLEALESRFERAGLKYWDARPPVCGLMARTPRVGRTRKLLGRSASILHRHCVMQPKVARLRREVQGSGPILLRSLN